MNYLDFKIDYINLCEGVGRNTKTKIKNDLKKDINELEFKIDHLQSEIDRRGFARMYGVIYFKLDLDDIIKELEFSKKLLVEL